MCKFVSFWLVMNLEELAGGSALYVRSQGEGICLDLSANPLSLLLYKWLAPSLSSAILQDLNLETAIPGNGQRGRHKTSKELYWLNRLSNTTNLWYIYVYYIGINYMFRRLWPSSGWWIDKNTYAVIFGMRLLYGYLCNKHYIYHKLVVFENWLSQI
jgi:hypothetical protein